MRIDKIKNQIRYHDGKNFKKNKFSIVTKFTYTYALQKRKIFNLKEKLFVNASKARLLENS